MEEQASFIRSARSPNNTTPSKLQKRALRESLQLSIDDEDVLPFLLSGLISHATSPQLWAALLSLSPHPRPYASTSELRSAANAYLQLLAILPPALLPFTSPAMIHGILSRDACNSFGIWSGTGARDGDEFLGYGIWPNASFFNHSCQPSVIMSREGERYVFRSWPLRVVKEGEELCISYLGAEENKMSLTERKLKLKNGWGFDCMCTKCFPEGNEGQYEE